MDGQEERAGGDGPGATVWDPAAYLRHAGERARPWVDLLARVRVAEPRLVVDLGCGAGNLTATLPARWPGARVVGVDASAEMLARARAGAALEWVEADLRTWRPPGPVDVLVCNAVLHWVPGHLELLPRLVGLLAPGGVLALQVPGNSAAASHALLRQVLASQRWAGRVPPLPEAVAAEPAEYLEVLAGCGCEVDVWETTYLHVLGGEDAVLGWMRGAALRPVLSALEEGAREELCAQYGALLRRAYPRRAVGTVLPYRRVFAVARGPA
ncbi:trans-aconitate 2-methyltransferase [Kineococcus sp. NUM-3379]